MKTHPDTREKVWVTEDQAARIENQWQEYNMRNSSEYRALREFLSESTFTLQEQELKERNPGISYKDLLWEMFEYARSIKPSALAGARAFYAFNTGRPHFEAAQMSYREDLECMSAQGVVKVKIEGGDDCLCNACKKLNGKKLTISEALAAMPIPCPNCITMLEPEDVAAGKVGWCRCSYSPAVSGAPRILSNDDYTGDNSANPATTTPHQTASPTKRRSQTSKKVAGCSLLALAIVVPGLLLLAWQAYLYR